jgi:hypothetical protein
VNAVLRFAVAVAVVLGGVAPTDSGVQACSLCNWCRANPLTIPNHDDYIITTHIDTGWVPEIEAASSQWNSAPRELMKLTTVGRRNRSSSGVLPRVDSSPENPRHDSPYIRSAVAEG